MFSTFIQNNDFHVDLWFCYGSFFYGVETKLYGCEESKMTLSVPQTNLEDQKNLFNFIETIIEKPKGLLRIELRVYIPDKWLKKYKLSSPVFLFTDILPEAFEKIDSSFLLQCSSVQGISPVNAENWFKLVRQISLQNSTFS